MTKAEKIRDYLSANPQIYEAFEAEALKIRDLGFEHYSSRMIIHYLRHMTNLEADPDGHYKINDHLSPTLARDFLNKHPEIPEKFFELRAAKVEPEV